MRVSYQERVPLIEAVLRRLGRPASVAEIYDELKGDERFGTPRRVAATFRYDQRQPRPVFTREGKERIAIRNPTDSATQFTYASEESRVYERGQTVVPKKVRDAIGAVEGSILTWEVDHGVAQVIAIPKDPIGALRGIMKGKRPTFEEYLTERNADRRRERELEENEEHRWRTYSTPQR